MIRKLAPLLILFFGVHTKASPETNLGEGYATVYFEFTVSSHGKVQRIEILKIVDGGDGSKITDLDIPEKQIKRIERSIKKLKYDKTYREESKRLTYWIYNLATKRFLKKK